MSFFRSLQNTPRVVTLFSNKVANSVSSPLLTQLKSIQESIPKDSGFKFNIEVHTSFPTKEQLSYMEDECQPKSILSKYIPYLKRLKNTHGNIASDALLSTPELGKSFSKDLKTLPPNIWKTNGEFWVDWEKKTLGDTVENFK
ncbi:uncharacterized protein SCODWIG_01443 [Saccharomycodes ludwigii]|uniref:Redox protein FMP46, mitochondrial n=1 Tax=Saccharomycodes ludwigii TaxID=36035 RepID=A0A376B4Y5_9ASCO|nr:hypothetical protein SCDLUD_002438 [Saccharomycodes ludwigii]KAH3900975.1 hypothetical protein SCDLUD_002438 [Saccharomycodes ludwigii]SSD59682.1 uncharacterized protein SCODWIG_01443 [Saccharomycodes ludwigii]